jgi:hypothetical protein
VTVSGKQAGAISDREGAGAALVMHVLHVSNVRRF